MRRYATIAGTAMAGLATRDLVKTGMDFEAAMSGVGAVMLKTREEMGSLTAEAKRLGATTKFTGSEAAAGMEIMAKAGYKEKDILTGISGMLNAAAASGGELAETADHVSNVLKGMGLATSDAGKVADVLALASSRTNSTISSLGESMKNVSAVAKHLGIPLEQVVAAVASLQDVGLDASVAGTATATMLTKLASPTDALRRKLTGMGVAFEDAKGNMLPFPEVLANLAKMAEKAGGNAKQLAAFAELMGLRGQKAGLQLQDLAKKGKLGELVELLREAAGTSERMAKIRLDNLSGDVTLFKSALDGLEVKLFGVQDGALRGIVQRSREWLTANEDIIAQDFAHWIDQLRPLGVIFSNAFMETLKGIGDAFDFWTGPLRDTESIACSPTWRGFAQTLGKVAAILIVGIPLVWGLNLAVRIASVGVWLFQVALRASALATAWLSKEAVIATVAEWRATAAVWASKLAHWARAAAIAIGTLGMRRFTLATMADTVKTGINTLAQWAKVTAQAAVNLAVKTGRGILKLYTAMTSAATLKDLAAIIALWAKAAAQWAVNLAVRGYNRIAGLCAQLTSGVGTAAGGAATGMGAFAATIAAAAAAVGALYLAFKQLQGLEDETEGLGFVGLLKQMWNQGTLDPAEALNTYQNMEAIERKVQRNVNARAKRRAGFASEQGGTETGRGTRWVETAAGAMPQTAFDTQKFSDAMSQVQKSLGAIGSQGQGEDQASMQEAMRRSAEAQEQLVKLVTPGERISRSVTEAIRTERTEAEVTIKDETGRASVTKAPRGKGFGLRVQPSGAF